MLKSDKDMIRKENYRPLLLMDVDVKISKLYLNPDQIRFISDSKAVSICDHYTN